MRSRIAAHLLALSALAPLGGCAATRTSAGPPPPAPVVLGELAAGGHRFRWTAKLEVAPTGAEGLVHSSHGGWQRAPGGGEHVRGITADFRSFVWHRSDDGELRALVQQGSRLERAPRVPGACDELFLTPRPLEILRSLLAAAPAAAQLPLDRPTKIEGPLPAPFVLGWTQFWEGWLGRRHGSLEAPRIAEGLGGWWRAEVDASGVRLSVAVDASMRPDQAADEPVHATLTCSLRLDDFSGRHADLLLEAELELLAEQPGWFELYRPVPPIASLD